MPRRVGALLVTLFAGCASPQSPPPKDPDEIDLTAGEPAPALMPPMCMETNDEGCVNPTAAPEGPAADDTVWSVPVDPEDPIRGPGSALVTLVVFSDFECPFCRRAAQILEELRQAHAADLRIVWKDYPLSMHHRAEAAALFARAVRAQAGNDAFWRAHDLLFERQPAFSDADFQDMATVLRVSWPEAARAMQARTHAPSVVRSRQLGDRVDVRKTPTVFINGRKVAGLRSRDALDALVRDEADRARALLAEGVALRDVYDRLITDGHIAPVPSDLP
jgi:protein-disulfide isomerase